VWSCRGGCLYTHRLSQGDTNSYSETYINRGVINELSRQFVVLGAAVCSYRNCNDVCSVTKPKQQLSTLKSFIVAACLCICVHVWIVL
jgi:hypothetical protein